MDDNKERMKLEQAKENFRKSLKRSKKILKKRFDESLKRSAKILCVNDMR